MTDPKLTVAVVSWNTRELLACCLESLRREVDVGRARVVVVDNASSDGSADMVEGRFAWAKVIRSEENLGFGPAVNLALEDAASPWVAAANADVEVTAGALDALLEAGERHPRAGAVAPRLVSADGSDQDSVYGFPSLATTLAAFLGLHRLSQGAADWIRFGGRRPERGAPSEVDFAMGAFLLIRRASFEAVGRFDPRQWMYAEDLDICWRLRQRGEPTLFVPAAVVVHAGGASSSQVFGAPSGTPQVVGAYYSWVFRRRGPGVLVAVAGLNLLGILLRVLGSAVIWPFSRSARDGLGTRWQWLRMNLRALGDARRIGPSR